MIKENPNNPVNYFIMGRYLSQNKEWNQISSNSDVCNYFKKAFKLIEKLESDQKILTKKEDDIYVYLLEVLNAGYCDFN